MHRMYKIDKKEAPKAPGIMIERSYGCDGRGHIEAATLIELNTAGDVQYEEELGDKEVGPCDRSCGFEDLGDMISPHFMPSARIESALHEISVETEASPQLMDLLLTTTEVQTEIWEVDSLLPVTDLQVDTGSALHEMHGVEVTAEILAA